MMGLLTRSDETQRRKTIFLTVIAVNCMGLLIIFSSKNCTLESTLTLPRTMSSSPKAHIVRPTIPTFKTRNDLGDILNDLSLTSGVELGVQRGRFADATLRKWKSCKRYVLVDLWEHQSNYNDSANYNTSIQDKFKTEALNRMKKFQPRTQIEVCHDYTTNCAAKYARSGDKFDYIYVDARHDYKGVLQDLNTWYPLLRPGGVLAGHDYVEQNEGPRSTGQDWTMNYDGTRDLTGRVAKGAVDDFARLHGLQLTISYREPMWNAWATRKPYD